MVLLQAKPINLFSVKNYHHKRGPEFSPLATYDAMLLDSLSLNG